MQFRLPLVAVRVVEVGAGPAAALCARLLGDLGAEVIKVEPPSAQGKGSERRHLDCNKLGLTLDTSKREGRDILLRLFTRADVAVLDGAAPATAEEVRAARRDVIVARAVDEGSGGGGVAPGDVMAGTALAGGVLAALLRHRRTGEGTFIEVDPGEKGAAAPQGVRSGLAGHAGGAGARVLEPVSTAGEGLVGVAGPVWHFSDTPVHVRLPAPRPGEHNAYVLQGLLRMGQEETSRLVAEGVIGPV